MLPAPLSAIRRGRVARTRTTRRAGRMTPAAEPLDFAQFYDSIAPVRRRRQLEEALAAMAAAETFEQWRQAAEAYDQVSGGAEWRAQDDSVYYDAASIRQSMRALRSAREAGDGLLLAELLTEDLYRHLNDFTAAGLYEQALTGTKHLVEEYLQECETSLRWLADWEAPELGRREKLRRFETAYKVFGESALLLSGGATWGFHHLGVVKALFEAELLPPIVSGASTGAMIAAGICARTDDELRALFADPSCLRLDGLRPVSLERALKTGARLDPEHLYEVLLHNCGPWTFAEAYERSGRTLNISVSPTRARQKPRLLTHLTAPDVLIARAAVASSALPGLFPPVVLHKRRPGGEVTEYIPSERWVDGSLHGDLPKQRLSRLHNVNHFIVSQTNPLVLPFMARRAGVGGAIARMFGATVRSQSGVLTDLARRASPAAPVAQLAEQAYALLSQEYTGDIDIHPRLTWKSYRKVVSNPTPEDLAHFIAAGERAVWPQIPKIRDQTRLAATFRACLAKLRRDTPEPPAG